MKRYPVYLEVAADRRCLAHVLDLPGCVVRAPTREEALRQLPDAIHAHHAWLRRHGESVAPADSPIDIEVVGETAGSGPFDPGDSAALLPPDRAPITPAEMELYFRCMAYARSDLLALVRDLPGTLLDWQPYPQSFTVRSLLRHLGNAEQWYVSRLVPRETLPPGWEDDEHLPIFTFLEMERRTAILRLQQLTDRERAATFHPRSWTRHPGEPWTARKALRRALEHEREHTAQARAILAARRRYLLARLAAERAALLEHLVGLDHRALAGFRAVGGWAVEDLLAHTAAWDRWQHDTMRSMVAGAPPDLSALHGFDAANETFIAAWHEQTAGLSPAEALRQVLVDLRAARADWIAWLEALTEEEFFRRRSYAGDDWSFDVLPLRVQWDHDVAHAAQIAGWRQSRGLRSEAGPKAVLLAALAAARDELLSAAALIPADQAASRPVCGTWTLKDVLGHVADWEWFGVEGLRDMAASQPPQVEPVHDIDAWNRSHARARHDQSWERVWTDLNSARSAFTDILGGMDEDDLARAFTFPWGAAGTPYQWIVVYLAHDREHARGLRGEEGETSDEP